MANKEEPRAVPSTPSTIHDIITGGLEGSVGVLAIEPGLKKLAGKAVENPFRAGLAQRLAVGGAVGAGATGLIGAIVSATTRKTKERKMAKQMMESPTSDMVEFAKKISDELDEKIPRAETKYRKGLTVAGIGAAALGASTLPGASKFFGIRGRATAKSFGFGGKNEGGKMVADYIEGSQLLLNRGLRGKLAGAVIGETLNNPGGVVGRTVTKAYGGSTQMGPRLTGEHFARFRAGPMEALKFWDYEHGNAIANRVSKQDEAAKATGRGLSEGLIGRRKRAADEMHYGREKAHSAIKEQVEVHGKSEMEALKHVAHNNSDPQVQHYFNELASHKAAAGRSYAIKSLASPAALALGTGGIVAGRGKDETPDQALRRRVKLEAVIEVLTEFDTYDPYADRSLKSGVRLDKYKKTIRAREIDRHIHDYARSAAIGSLAGMVLPAPGSLKQRALVGAGAGTAAAALLHGVGHKDAYGEQSEEAKLIQRNAPKYAGAAAILGGLIARAQKRRFGSPTLNVRVKMPWSK